MFGWFKQNKLRRERYTICEEISSGIAIIRDSYPRLEGAKEIARIWAEKHRGVRFIVVDTRIGLRICSVRRPPDRR